MHRMNQTGYLSVMATLYQRLIRTVDELQGLSDRFRLIVALSLCPQCGAREGLTLDLVLGETSWDDLAGQTQLVLCRCGCTWPTVINVEDATWDQASRVHEARQLRRATIALDGLGNLARLARVRGVIIDPETT